MLSELDSVLSFIQVVRVHIRSKNGWALTVDSDKEVESSQSNMHTT